MAGAQTGRLLLVDLDNPDDLRALAERLAPLLNEAGAAQRSSSLLTTAQAASRLGVHPKTVEKWCRIGRAPDAVKVGRGWRIPDTPDALARLGGGSVVDPVPPSRPARRRRSGAESSAARATAAILGTGR